MLYHHTPLHVMVCCLIKDKHLYIGQGKAQVFFLLHIMKTYGGMGYSSRHS